MTISNLLKQGTSLGLKNFFPLLGTLILYMLTIWIPYINVGTTIALYSLPAVMSRGKTISPTHIFDSKYRKNMGNFFLLIGFMFSGLLVGFFFLIIPGIILMYAWSIAILLLVDKGLNPMQALHESNSRTYGHKGTIFLSFLCLGIIWFVLNVVIEIIFGLVLYGNAPSFYQLEYFLMRLMYSPGSLVGLAGYITGALYFCIKMGIMAEVYKHLVINHSEEIGE